MNMKKLALILLFLVVAGRSKADQVSLYDVTIDTSSVATLTGAIYFQFSPGNTSGPASAVISSFLIGAPGSLDSNPFFTDGDVSGSLTALPLTMGNTFGLNDYLHFLVYGDSIQFRVGISYPVPLTGDGSAFLFGLTADDGLSPILTLDPLGMLGQIAFDQNGVFAADQLSDFATITPVASEVPEPSTLPLLSAILGLLALRCTKRRSKFAVLQE